MYIIRKKNGTAQFGDNVGGLEWRTSITYVNSHLANFLLLELAFNCPVFIINLALTGRCRKEKKDAFLFFLCFEECGILNRNKNKR